mmetsp:Transcript_11983/g.38355  ORF Transcript_11983/g.38355 Transcript_11983/m.38355 type:complete len:248 (-) Transcript_11983:693-1436(-)
MNWSSPPKSMRGSTSPWSAASASYASISRLRSRIAPSPAACRATNLTTHGAPSSSFWSKSTRPSSYIAGLIFLSSQSRVISNTGAPSPLFAGLGDDDETLVKDSALMALASPLAALFAMPLVVAPTRPPIIACCCCRSFSTVSHFSSLMERAGVGSCAARQTMKKSAWRSDQPFGLSPGSNSLTLSGGGALPSFCSLVTGALSSTVPKKGRETLQCTSPSSGLRSRRTSQVAQYEESTPYCRSMVRM